MIITVVRRDHTCAHPETRDSEIALFHSHSEAVEWIYHRRGFGHVLDVNISEYSDYFDEIDPETGELFATFYMTLVTDN